MLKILLSGIIKTTELSMTDKLIVFAESYDEHKISCKNNLFSTI
jgi:hypothetical protein